MEYIITLISLVIVSYLFSYLLKKVKIPQVVSLIILGVIFGSTPLGDFVIEGAKSQISLIGSIGIFSLMFLAGLKSSYKTLIKEEKDSFAIAIIGTMFTFFSAMFVFFLLGFSLLESFVIAICLSITAEGTKAKILIEFKKIKTRVAQAMIGAGIIDDTLALLLFSGVLFFVGGVVDFHEHLMLLSLLLSFVLGLLTQHFFEQHHLTKKLEISLTYFIIPFFFIDMGSNFNIVELMDNLNLAFIMIIVGTLGKLIGTILAKSHTNFSYKQLQLIGWGMNSRGAIEIALALIALNAGIIDQIIFSALVLTALVTTLAFPLCFEYFLSKDKKL